MKTAIKHIITYTLPLMLAACAEDTIDMPGAANEKMPIRLGAAYPTVSRASDAGFEDGDNMGVYVMDYQNDIPQEITGDDIHADNVKFKFNGSDNSWSGATEIYWTSNTTPVDIIGYYPFMPTIDDEASVPFSIDRRQDLPGNENEPGGYEASDFLWAKALKVMPTSSRVNLTFSHLMAGVRVNLEKGTGFEDDEWNSLDKTVLVSNIVPDATINLAEGEVTAGNNSPISVTPYEFNGEWRAVVVPQTVNAGTTIMAISVDGISYNLIKNEAMTYVAGKLHSFTITVNRSEPTGTFEFVVTDEAITPWIDDVEFRDGIMRDYIVVNVEKRGSLTECIKTLGLNEDDILNLKLTGELDEQDFKYLRENLDYLKSLNLYDAEVYAEGKKTVIPAGALSGKATLNHIVFPRHLTIIGSCAFTDCGLMGDMIIPEGVTHIGTGNDLDGATPGHWGGGAGVFTNCASLVGNLSLPSTLVFIESGAFCRAPLTGELIIPESVRFIGSIAFDNTKFTGSLSLPENIEEIGIGAFFRVPLTGNLTIPQGIKIIRPQTFTEGNYSLLSLPEGIIEINEQAFLGCGFRGELKLPSSLKLLGNNAFEKNNFSSIIFPERLSYMGSQCFAYNSRLSGSISIPDGITAINHGTFVSCTMLDEVIIGENITKIEGEAFGGCYNLSSIIINNPEPPLLTTYTFDSSIRDAFYMVPKDNFTLQVPEKSVSTYASTDGWREFKRIAAYSNFVCRPATACALTSRHQETLVLNSDGDWEITHQPDWCTVSRTSGSGKTELTLTINEMSKGSGNRTDYVEFSLKGTEFTTRCNVSQYDYRYGEDECVTLRSASQGDGIDILFVGDGFDGAAISEGKYLDLVNEQMEAFFGVEPYNTYKDYFNVYVCISLSQENGVNTANTWRNTRFTTLFTNECSGTTGNLIHDDIDAVFDYAVKYSPLTAERMPKSLIIMALNSDEYGSATTLTWNGSAISICCASSDPYPMDTRGIIQHEACGHGFGKLAEERIVRNRYLTAGEKQEIENQHSRGWYQNISTTGKMADVPWSHFIFDPRYSNSVDIFEGGFGATRGAYRCEINSCMNYGIPYFNAISRQDIVRRILEYSGEGFTMEKFYATDSDKWGTTSTSRAAMVDETESYVASGSHHPVRIVKSNKY